MCIRLVSRICHEGAAANVDFKLCRRQLDDHKTSYKVKTSSSEAKIVELEWEVLRFFKAGRKRGPMDYPSFRWREKSSSRFEFRRENGLSVQVFRNSSVQP